MNVLIKIFSLISILCSTIFSQGIGVGTRYDLTQKLNLSTGQFAQLFVPDYYTPPEDGKFILVFHLHSASWAAEDQVYKSRTNAILFNIHLGALSSPYQNYFTDQNKFSTILDTIISVIAANKLFPNPQIKNLIVTSFSAGYAGLREILKTEVYYEKINAINLADGLHCSNDLGTAAVQLQDFLKFAKDAIQKVKIMLITHSSIQTSGYWSTTETADYLLQHLNITALSVNEIDEINAMYAKSDTGNFHLKRYLGETAEDHLKHLYAMNIMLEAAIGILEDNTTGVIENKGTPIIFFCLRIIPILLI